MELQIGDSHRRNKGSSGWLSFFYASLVILALVWLSVVYLPRQFTQFREEINQTVDEKLTSHTAELTRSLNAVEEEVSKLEFLNDTEMLNSLLNQEQALKTRLETLNNEIAASEATIQSLTQTIAEYEEGIAKLELQQEQLEKEIENAQEQ